MRNVFFVLGEGVAIYFSVILCTWLLMDAGSFGLERLFSKKALLIAAVCHIFLYYNDLYDLRVTGNFTELSIRLFQSLGCSAIFLAGVYFLFPQVIIAKGIFAISILIAMGVIISWRYLYMIVLDRGWFNEKIVLVGSGGLAQSILSEITQKKDSGYTVSCVILETAGAGKVIRSKGVRGKHLDGFRGLSRIVRASGAKKVVVALAERRGGFPTQELLKCRVLGINIVEGIGFFEMLTGKLIVHQVRPTWLIFSEGFRKSPLRLILKRVTDLVLSLSMLVCVLPLIAVVALLIKIDSKGNILFSQERVGEKRKSYRVVKFRSMVENAEKLTGPVWAGDDDPRITRVGKIIRKLRIDEVPQLWNVLKGEMSFVGPRPEREYFVNQLEEIIPYYSERFAVKPGITGWAQVSYGYGASVEDAIEKLNYDLFYIKNMSIFMDLMIVLKTVKIVLFGKGAR